jgi:hypothetical protein
MGLLKTVSKYVGKMVIGDDSQKKAQHREAPVMRMMITEEPRPTHHQQVSSWINGSNVIPDRAARINQRINEIHNTDYMAFPQGEGTLGVHKIQGMNHNPHDVDKFYSNTFSTHRRKR